MLLFSVLVALFLLVLAWAEEIVGVFLSDEVMVGCGFLNVSFYLTVQNC